MVSEQLDRTLESIPQLKKTGTMASRSIHEAVLRGGTRTRKLADILHGTWIGHPLHPILTDLTVGAWVSGAMFDVIASVTNDETAKRIADAMIRVGTWSAIPTAITGLADYSTVQKSALPVASLHALINDINIVLYALSLRDRKRGRRGRGVMLSMTAIVLASLSAWLGGHLVYRHRVGVDNSSQPEVPEEWTDVAEAATLSEGGIRCVPVADGKVLLYREGDTVFAIDAQCSHAGGPLEEGEVRDGRVQCPWHDSVFDLKTGDVVHGPATHLQVSYQARMRDGRIEIRNKATD